MLQMKQSLGKQKYYNNTDVLPHTQCCHPAPLLNASSLTEIFSRSLGQAFYFKPLCSLEELWQLVLGHVYLPGIHELQDGSQVVEGDILQDDDGVLGWVLLQQVPKVGAAGAQDHLVGLGVLPLSGDGDITKGLIGAEVLEGVYHVGLEIVPAETKLLSISRSHLARRNLVLQEDLKLQVFYTGSCEDYTFSAIV